MKRTTILTGLLLATALTIGPAAWAAGGVAGDGTAAVGGGGSSFEAPGGTATNQGVGAAEANPAGLPAGPPAVAPTRGAAPMSAIRNGHDIEPQKGVVTGEEKAAGVAAPPAQSRRETALVERQANRMIRKSQAETRNLPGSTEAH